MIEFSELINLVIDRLDKIITQPRLYYHIMSDTGEYKSPSREGNEVTEYINGVINITSSDIVSIAKDIPLATITARLDLIVTLPDLTTDEVYNHKALETVTSKVNEIRKVLNYLSKENYTDIIDDYTVSSIYQMAISGERSIYPNIGDGIVFSVNIFWIVVYKGLNSSALTFNLDGIVVPYQAFTINRAKTYDSNVFADTTTGEVENIPIQSNWSVTFELPATTGDFFEKVFSFLVCQENQNEVHCLNFHRSHANGVSTANNSYLVSLAEGTLNGETVKNAGLKITFVKARNNYYAVSLPATYRYYKVINTTPPPIEDILTPGSVSLGSTTGGAFYMRKSDMKPVYAEGGAWAVVELDEIIILVGNWLPNNSNLQEWGAS